LERNQFKSIQDFWSWEPIRNSGEAISNQFGVADMPAGPSELLIVADDSSVAAFVLLIYYLKQNTVQTAK
jgi:hypothetical protein